MTVIPVVDLVSAPGVVLGIPVTGRKLPAGWTHKLCPGCGYVRPRSAFGPNKSKKPKGASRQSRCRGCMAHYARVDPRRAERRRAAYRRDPQRAIQKSTDWKRANPERHKDLGRRAKYGCPLGTYARLLAEQGGGCAICGAPPPEGKSLHVDHDAETGRVRSLLCDLHNRGLGYFGHDPELLERAADYLRWHARLAHRGGGAS